MLRIQLQYQMLALFHHYDHEFVFHLLKTFAI